MLRHAAAIAAVFVMGLPGDPAQAQPRLRTLPEPVMVMMSEPDDPDILALAIQPGFGQEILVMLASSSPNGCRFAAGPIEVPIQLDRSGFQLKRFTHRRLDASDGSGCDEALVTTYPRGDLHTLASAQAIVWHMPGGPLSLPVPAIDAIRAAAAEHRDAEPTIAPASFRELLGRLTAMLADGQVRETLEVAEQIAPLIGTRPAHEGVAFYGLLGMARRRLDDLEGGARCYRVALMIADEARLDIPEVGVVADNLATVRRLQGRWADAEAASDRALAVFALGGAQSRRMLGFALNNRAVLALNQQQHDRALVLSEQALAILREELQDDRAGLAPFLEDNRTIREMADQARRTAAYLAPSSR